MREFRQLSEQVKGAVAAIKGLSRRVLRRPTLIGGLGARSGGKPSVLEWLKRMTRRLGSVYPCVRRTSPAQYVEPLRIEAARRLLAETQQGVEEIAAACGFSSAELMRRAFLRSIGAAPSQYRERFRSAGNFRPSNRRYRSTRLDRNRKLWRKLGATEQ